MKIEINIEKKHLYFFVGFLILIVGGYVIAQGSYTGGIPTSGVGHQDLYVSHIYPWTEGGGIKINGPDVGQYATTYARLDFENNTDNFWTIMYKTNPNRLLFSYKNINGWVPEVASFREDGSLWLKEGKICDDSTDICYKISDLGSGTEGGNGGDGQDTGGIDILYEGTNLLYNGKKLFNDDATAQEFCLEKGFTGYTDLQAPLVCVEGEHYAKYSSSWSDWICGTGSIQTYINSLTCTGGTGIIYSFNEGSGDAGLSIDPLDMDGDPSTGSYNQYFYFLFGEDETATQFCIDKQHTGFISYTTIQGTGANCGNAENNAGEILIRYFDPPGSWTLTLTGGQTQYILGWYGVECQGNLIIDTITCTG